MISQFDLIPDTPEYRGEYGVARVRDVAFDAVMALWRRRKSEGMTQADLAQALGANPAWLSRNLSGPGNWTLRTIGRLVAALNGEIEVKVHALEDPSEHVANYDAYSGYIPHPGTPPGFPVGLALTTPLATTLSIPTNKNQNAVHSIIVQ